MEKYGVEEKDAPKTAEKKDGEVCPACGAPLRPVTSTGVRICPRCGSKPFEANDHA